MKKALNILSDTELAKIISDEKEDYSTRREALLNIRDINLLNSIAANVHEEWMKLEAASISNNTDVLRELTMNENDQVRLEAALELKDQDTLVKIARENINEVTQDKILDCITEQEKLKEIALYGATDKIRTEAAIRTKEYYIINTVFHSIRNDWLKYKLCVYSNDIALLHELAESTKDEHLKSVVDDLLDMLNPENTDDLD